MVADEARAFARAVLGVFERAFPLQHRPAGIVVLGELGEDGPEVDLAVAERAEAARTLGPAQIAAIDAHPPIGPELRVLDVEGANARVVGVDEGEIVQLLQDEVRRVVEDVGARVVVDRIQEPLEGGAVEQILARVQLVAGVDPRVVEGVEDRAPAAGELVEGLLDQAGRALRPGVHVGPGQGPGEGGHGGQAEVAAGLGGRAQLALGPFAPAGRVGQLGRGEGGEQPVVGRVHRQELALQVGGEFGDLQPALGQPALDVVAVGLAVGGQLDVEGRADAGRHLHPLVAERGGPAGQAVQGVERRLRAQELGQEDAGAFQGSHRFQPFAASSRVQPARFSLTAVSTKAAERRPSSMVGTPFAPAAPSRTAWAKSR